MELQYLKQIILGCKSGGNGRNQNGSKANKEKTAEGPEWSGDKEGAGVGNGHGGRKLLL